MCFSTDWRHLGAHREAVHQTSYCLRSRFSAASDAHLADAAFPPARDRSCPTDITSVVAPERINRTLLSADKSRCQAEFFCTTFCGAHPLAQTDRECSARPHYLASCSERSMKGRRMK